MPQPKGNAQGIGHVNSRKVLNTTLVNGGGTFTPLGSPIKPAFGFSLSLDPERTKVVPVNEFTATTVELFAMNNLPFINEYNSEHARAGHGLKMLGTWVDEGLVHLDVVTVIVTKDVNKIMAMAADSNQIAVYDFSTGKALAVDDFYAQEYASEVHYESLAQ